jgi:hypothetical protein
MHQAAYTYVAHALANLTIDGAHVVEIGSYDVNSTEQGLSIRALCAGAASYIGIDRRKGPGVDRVMRAHDLGIADIGKPADIIICCETLEHERDPEGIIAAAQRLLRSGGVLVLTAAGPGRDPHGCDGGPVGDEPYGNISRAELKTWLAEWESAEIKEDHTAHDIYATATRNKSPASLTVKRTPKGREMLAEREDEKKDD